MEACNDIVTAIKWYYKYVDMVDMKKWYDIVTAKMVRLWLR